MTEHFIRIAVVDTALSFEILDDILPVILQKAEIHHYARHSRV